QSNDLVARRWPALTLTTLVSHLGLYLVFLLTTRLVGITSVEVSWVELLGIFSLGRLLTAAPITPGGVGLVEFTYIAGLVLAGGGPGAPPRGGPVRAQAVAAALLFRVLTYGLQIPLGGFTYLIWQRNKSWRKPLHPDTPSAMPVLPSRPPASQADGEGNGEEKPLTSSPRVGGDRGKRRSAQRFPAVC